MQTGFVIDESNVVAVNFNLHADDAYGREPQTTNASVGSTFISRLASEALTHEGYIHNVREIAASRLNAEDRKKVLEAKLVYGAGAGRGARGMCFHDAWCRDRSNALIEVSAFGEESKVQLAGTTLHELGHCLAGYNAGHGPAWKSACRALGLARCLAASQAYDAKDFVAEVWVCLIRLPDPSDGVPVLRASASPRPVAITGRVAPCPLGNGTKGGISRGPGSGSRLRLYMCECPEDPFRVRVARDDFQAQCLKCGSMFQRVAATEKHSRSELPLASFGER
jgi:hypothetical protein